MPTVLRTSLYRCECRQTPWHSQDLMLGENLGPPLAHTAIDNNAVAGGKAAAAMLTFCHTSLGKEVSPVPSSIKLKSSCISTNHLPCD